MDLIVEYNQNDFLYYKFGVNNASNPTGLVLNGETKPNCDTTHNTLGSHLCENKRKADTLLANTTTHAGSDEMYENAISKYNNERLTTFNLTVGILAAIGAIFRFR
jgi:hypothetical protein